MSMVGIRDMSLLQSPPEERYPVQTYVVEYSDGLVRDAILRELGRGGQVYVLHNRVQTIDVMYARLKKLVPEARIAVGHGQMREHALEDVMMDFYEGKFDVLLCTTIIEAGLDVPRGQHAHRLRRGPLRPGAALSAARPRGPQQPPGLRLSHRQPRTRCSPRRPKSGSGRHPGVHRVRLAASAWPCAIWRSAARATCWARSRAASWPRWATTSTSR